MILLFYVRKIILKDGEVIRWLRIYVVFVDDFGLFFNSYVD